MEKETLFHKILNKEIEAFIVYEDDSFMVILDAFPAKAGHSLVIPKKYSENLKDIDDRTFLNLMSKSKLIAKSIIKSLDVEGFTLIINNGQTSGQKVFYTHVHIIPTSSGIYKNDFKKIHKIIKIDELN